MNMLFFVFEWKFTFECYWIKKHIKPFHIHLLY